MAINIDVMLENLSSSFGDLKKLITAVSYVAGAAMIFRAIGMFKAFGQHITQMSSRGEVAGPIVYFVVGTVLIYLPSTLDTSFQTLFQHDYGQQQGAGSLLAYVQQDSSEQWRRVIDIIINYMDLVGLVAFIRGWFILSRMGNPGVQPGSFGKGLTHIIGGILAMNVVEVMHILGDSLGWGQ